MQWEGRRGSVNVEDRRGMSGRSGCGVGGVGGGYPDPYCLVNGR